MRKLTPDEEAEYAARNLGNFDIGLDTYYVPLEELADVSLGQRTQFSVAYKGVNDSNLENSDLPHPLFIIEAPSTLTKLAREWKQQQSGQSSSSRPRGDSLSSRQRAKRH
jgi:hypothetical protein